MISFRITLLLFLFFSVARGYPQEELKEKLKLLESKGELLFQEISRKPQKKQKTVLYTSLPTLQLASRLDSLKVFVMLQKEDKESSFEKSIVPYLEDKIQLWDMITLDFSNDEELIVESFIKTSEWEKTLSRVALYHQFVNTFANEESDYKEIIFFLSFVKESYLYTNATTNNSAQHCVSRKLREEFEMYNSVDWIVFARNPGAMLLWLTATFVWEYDLEKCTEKL